MVVSQNKQLKNVLITGATGLIGTGLVEKLKEEGHHFSVLSRNPKKVKNARAYRWDIEKQEIDKECLVGIDTIIHLAGAGIIDEKWTPERKAEIITSRTASIKLLYKLIQKTNSSIDTIIAASAVGYYGDRGNEVLTEESGNGSGFLAECCRKWEMAVDEGAKYGCRIVKIRIGLLLTKRGGALSQFEKPIRCFLGAPLGTGKQWMPWIHFEDLLGIFIHAVKDPIYRNALNACAPSPVTNYEFTRLLAGSLHRPLWPLNVPEIVLKLF